MSRTTAPTPSLIKAKPMRALRHSVTPLALALSLAMAPAMAQNVSGDQRFTPVLGQATPLFPQSPQTQNTGSQALYAQPGNVDYRVNAGVDRVVVEVDRDGAPADGQTPVHVVVQLFGADGKLLNRPSDPGGERAVSTSLQLMYYGVHTPTPKAVVSPNGDGVDETQELSYKVVRPSNVTATLTAPGGGVAFTETIAREPGTYPVAFPPAPADPAAAPVARQACSR